MEINIPEKTLKKACLEYSKSYLYFSLFLQCYEKAENMLLEHNAYNKNLLGKHKELQRAVDRFDELMKKHFDISGKELLKDYDNCDTIFNGILDGKYKAFLNDKEINLIKHE